MRNFQVKTLAGFGLTVAWVRRCHGRQRPGAAACVRHLFRLVGRMLGNRPIRPSMTPWLKAGCFDVPSWNEGGDEPFRGISRATAVVIAERTEGGLCGCVPIVVRRKRNEPGEKPLVSPLILQPLPQRRFFSGKGRDERASAPVARKSVRGGRGAEARPTAASPRNRFSQTFESHPP